MGYRKSAAIPEVEPWIRAARRSAVRLAKTGWHAGANNTDSVTLGHSPVRKPIFAATHYVQQCPAITSASCVRAGSRSATYLSNVEMLVESWRRR